MEFPINLAEIQQYMNDKIFELLNQKIDELEIILLNQNPNLSSEIHDLIKKYRYTYNYQIISKTDLKSNIDTICEAKTMNNQPCTRKKLKDQSYCKIHSKRLNKSLDPINISDIDLGMYFETIQFKHNDQDYLIDLNGIIYLYHNPCQIVGHQIDDEITWWGT